MLPYKSLIALEKSLKTPLFLQITNNLMDNIKIGLIPKGTKLLGSRALSDVLGVSRQTVVAAYDELLAQGWLEIKAAQGTFVSSKIPVFKPIHLDKSLINNNLSDINFSNKSKTGFNFDKKDYLKRPLLRGSSALTFDDGFPDIRLAPIDELARTYRSVLQKGYQKNMLFYGDTKGEITLRQEITTFLKETRGLNITIDNVMIGRGSMMGMFLTANTVLKTGDKVAVGALDYTSVGLIFQNTGSEFGEKSSFLQLNRLAQR